MSSTIRRVGMAAVMVAALFGTAAIASQSAHAVGAQPATCGEDDEVVSENEPKNGPDDIRSTDESALVCLRKRVESVKWRAEVAADTATKAAPESAEATAARQAADTAIRLADEAASASTAADASTPAFKASDAAYKATKAALAARANAKVETNFWEREVSVRAKGAASSALFAKAGGEAKGRHMGPNVEASIAERAAADMLRTAGWVDGNSA